MITRNYFCTNAYFW